MKDKKGNEKKDGRKEREDRGEGGGGEEEKEEKRRPLFPLITSAFFPTTATRVTARRSTGRSTLPTCPAILCSSRPKRSRGKTRKNERPFGVHV